MMIDALVHTILQQLQQPKQDLEHNLRAVLTEAITKMDLVTQDELKRQQQALLLANQRLSALQQQLCDLQQRLDSHSETSSAEHNAAMG